MANETAVVTVAYGEDVGSVNTGLGSSLTNDFVRIIIEREDVGTLGTAEIFAAIEKAKLELLDILESTPAYRLAP